MGVSNMAKLTKREVDAAEAASAAVFIWDDEIKGFRLRITPGGQTRADDLSLRPLDQVRLCAALQIVLQDI
jgi:hypothetical protein